MDKPKIVYRKPLKVEVNKGEDQYWCACGLRSKQPFCDGSHSSTDITPVKFTPEETGDAYLCMCKQTKNPPYCDGTHATLKEENTTSETLEPVSSGATKEEPTLAYIKALAKDGLSKTGHHSEMGAMGVPIPELPMWKDIQLLAAQMATKPLLEDVAVGSELIIGPNAKMPLKLDISLFVSDMSFGGIV
jgi:CDGSH-type Zn-finger protein